MQQNDTQPSDPTPVCTRIAVYATPRGEFREVPLPPNVIPATEITVRGHVHVLLATITPHEGETIDQAIVREAREVEEEIAALLLEGDAA